MRAKAFLYSIFVHLALLGAMAYFYYRHLESPAPDSAGLVVEAPLGQVFVREEAPQAKKNAEPPPAEQPELPDPGAYPKDVKEMPFADAESNSGGEEPGVPDGEAEPVGIIEPVYPALSRKLGEEGEATFILGIDADGSVLNASLEKSTGHGRLDQAARDALLQARFRPTLEEGQPVLAMKRFRVEFRLSGSANPLSGQQR